MNAKKGVKQESSAWYVDEEMTSFELILHKQYKVKYEYQYKCVCSLRFFNIFELSKLGVK